MSETTLADMITEEDLFARLEAINQIRHIYQWRRVESRAGVEVKKLDPSASDYGKMGALRRWLLDHPGEELVDDEAPGYVAKLQPGGTSAPAYDLPTAIRKRAPALDRRLAELGCYVVDGKRVAEMIAAGLLAEADVAPFRGLGTERSPALKITLAAER